MLRFLAFIALTSCAAGTLEVKPSAADTGEPTAAELDALAEQLGTLDELEPLVAHNQTDVAECAAETDDVQARVGDLEAIAGDLSERVRALEEATATLWAATEALQADVAALEGR